MNLLRYLVTLLFGDLDIRSRSSDSLAEWMASPSYTVKHATDPVAKYCLENLGQPVRVIYKRKARIIVPRRVYSKPRFQKSYVDAESDGQLKTFDIDDMRIPKTRRR